MTTLFGSVAVGTMLASYWLEPRSRWFILSFSLGCVATVHAQRPGRPRRLTRAVLQ
jgi:hypothetical protein